MKDRISDIIGVVVAGGRSKRMGHDKGLIRYKDKAHRYFLADLLSEFFDEVLISVPYDFQIPERSKYKYIKDIQENIGPMGALHSLFKSYPGRSFLLLAADMPEVEEKHISLLVNQRDKKAIASCFENPDGYPEPLFSIWEAASKEQVDKMLLQNKYSLVRILKQNNVKMIKPLDYKILTNINTPEEKKDYLNSL